MQTQQGTGASPANLEPELIDDLVVANWILVDQGVLDGFGHVSVRNPRDPQRFFMARHMAPGLVQTADIREFGLDGEPTQPDGTRSYSERFIHSSIYAARPDVLAVVHSHSSSIIPFGLTDVPLRAVYHMGGFLGTSTPVFEIRDGGGDETDMMVRSPYLGDLLAKSLGDRAAVLMRGHGSTAVGNSIKQVVYRAIYAEANARLTMDALRLGNGKVKYLNEKEAANAAASNDKSVERPWAIWKETALENRGG